MYHGNLVATWATHMAHPSPALAWSVRQSLATPTVDHFTTRLAIRLNAFLSQKADVIIYNSSSAREGHEARSFSASKGTVLPNGFDTKACSPRAGSSQEVRHELQVLPHAPLIGHVARWHPVKDHRTLLAALARVTRQSDEIVCAMVGDGVDANNRELTDTVNAFGLQRNVRLLGRRTDIARLQAAFDVACLSSRAESFPNAIGEAMCAGVPCVSTAVGDVANLIADTGRIVPVGDPEALADALLDLISMDTERLQDLGLRARRRIVENYSIESVSGQYASLYDRITDQHPGQIT
jgi:glycosyltransferase involved in cell wall biosynthesis